LSTSAATSDGASARWDVSYEWKAVALLALAFGTVGLDRMVLAPLFPFMAKDLHLNYSDLGNIVGILGVFWGISAYVMGNLSDRVGRRRVLVPCIIVFSLLSWLTGVATGLLSLLVIRSVMGLAEGAVASTGVAVCTEASYPPRRGINQGIFQCVFALLGSALAPIIATQMLTFTTWRNVFLIAGIPGVIVAILIALTIREPATIGKRAADGSMQRASLGDAFKDRNMLLGLGLLGVILGILIIGAKMPASHGMPPIQIAFIAAAIGFVALLAISGRNAFQHRNVLLGMAALVCAMTGVFVMGAMMPTYLIDFLKLSPTQMGFVSSAIGFGGFLGQFGLPAISDLIGRKMAVLGAFVLAAIFLWTFAHTGAGNLGLLFVLLFGAAMFNFGALAVIAGPLAAEAAPIGLISSVAGMVIGMGEVFGGGIAPSIAGTIAQTYGLQYILYFALAGQLLGLLFALFFKETAPRKVGLASGAAAAEASPAE
jgi:MFS family permease